MSTAVIEYTSASELTRQLRCEKGLTEMIENLSLNLSKLPLRWADHNPRCTRRDCVHCVHLRSGNCHHDVCRCVMIKETSDASSRNWCVTNDMAAGCESNTWVLTHIDAPYTIYDCIYTSAHACKIDMNQWHGEWETRPGLW